MIKVCHVITGLNNGGAETMLLKLLSSIDKSRFDVCVISLTNRGVMAERLEAFGIPVFTCNISVYNGGIAGFLRLLSFIRKFKPSLVQTWLYHADLIGGVAARLLGIRNVVWNVRQSNLDQDKNKALTLAVVRLNARLSSVMPRKIICNSSNAATIHQHIGYLPAPFVIIPNGFDINEFRPDPRARVMVREVLKLPAKCLLVGLIARFDAQKNHQGFCEAAALVLGRLPNAHFVLAGTGVDWSNAQLVSWLDLYGIRQHVSLLGRRDDIPRLTAALDVAVSASWGEGFPNAVGEAMACQVPCVVTDVGDCAQIVGDTGWVVAPGDSQALAQRVTEALSLSLDAREKLGEAARARIQKNYALPAVVAQYEALYLDLLTQDCT